MHEMSKEQRAVFDYIRAGYNVIVDACAGSGKSTTILSIAQELTSKKIRQFTYNSMLRHEVKEKIKELELDNLQVHTYHSFAVKYYSASAYTDTGIRQIIRDNILPRTPIPCVDIVVLDESQDMTFLYFQLIVKMAKDTYNASANKKTFQLLVLGDYMQGLYEFKGADIRYLTKAEHFWSVLPYLSTPQFRKCTLQMSYRITHQMSKFVNRDMLGEERLKACREGVPVIYIRRSLQQIEKIVVTVIKRLLDEGESPSDIFVLGSSVKGANSNIKYIENVLTENDIPCYVPMNEVDAPDERVIDGKVVFSTFHTVKGRQRKYVFVVGFDQNYFYNLPAELWNVCPNTLYVACTRATHCLYLLENDRSRPLKFLKQIQPVMKQCDYIDFKGMPQTYFPMKQDTQNSSIVTIPTHRVTPTNLIKFVQETVLEEITPILERIFVQECEIVPENAINIPTIIKTQMGGLYEDVSDLNGIAIPAMYFDNIFATMNTNLGQEQNIQTPGSSKIREMINESVQEMKTNDHLFLKRAVNSLPEKYEMPEQYLYLANVYVAVQDKLYSKLKQIRKDEYDWITPEIVDKCCFQMECNLGHEFKNVGETIPEIEKLLVHHSMDPEHILIDAALYPYFSYETRFRFTARVDLITENTLWELKCTSKITLEHLMQVVIYAWIMRILNPEKEKMCKILNIKTGERMRLDATTDELTQIVVALLRGKYGKIKVLDDNEFIAQCREYILDNSQDKQLSKSIDAVGSMI